MYKIIALILLSLTLSACQESPKPQAKKNCHCEEMPKRFAGPSQSDNTQSLETNKQSHSGMRWIKKGTYEMGADNEQARDDEYPKLARIYNLHYRNREILVQGFPMNEDNFGPHAAYRGDPEGHSRFITLRNLSWEPIKYTIPLNDAAKECNKFNVLTISELVGEAIIRSHTGDSVTSLFV